MTETKEIARLYVVTDSETSYDNIGDINGGMLEEKWLKQHIISHGTEGLLEQLGGMIRQVLNTKYDYNREKSELDNKAMCKSIEPNSL
jgi:hypothetical protein